jgi:hypothetical protein
MMVFKTFSCLFAEKIKDKVSVTLKFVSSDPESYSESRRDMYDCMYFFYTKEEIDQ